mmetsp:Transcript_7526/g.15500  ORF Transcript_7526/g.15500 Transcript_7526/m.15500 type:complete len:295 (+) Transcript_7526:213-1097(+)
MPAGEGLGGRVIQQQQIIVQGQGKFPQLPFPRKCRLDCLVVVTGRPTAAVRPKDDVGFQLVEIVGHFRVNRCYRAKILGADAEQEAHQQLCSDKDDTDRGDYRHELHVDPVGLKQDIDRLGRVKHADLELLDLDEHEADQPATEGVPHQTGFHVGFVLPRGLDRGLVAGCRRPVSKAEIAEHDVQGGFFFFQRDARHESLPPVHEFVNEVPKGGPEPRSEDFHCRCVGFSADFPDFGKVGFGLVVDPGCNHDFQGSRRQAHEVPLHHPVYPMDFLPLEFEGLSFSNALQPVNVS